MLKTAEAMKELPAVEQAYRRGQMAENQAIDVALAAQHRSNETASAQAADALVEMAESVRHGGGRRVPSGPAAMVHLRIDLESLRRGHTDAGEVCEVPGVGPIPNSRGSLVYRRCLECGIRTGWARLHPSTGGGGTGFGGIPK